jgi:hypothetical protein
MQEVKEQGVSRGWGHMDGDNEGGAIRRRRGVSDYHHDDEAAKGGGVASACMSDVAREAARENAVNHLLVGRQSSVLEGMQDERQICAILRQRHAYRNSGATSGRRQCCRWVVVGVLVLHIY